MSEGKIRYHGSGDEFGIFPLDFGEERFIFGAGELSEDKSGESFEDACLSEVVEVSVDVMGRFRDVFKGEDGSGEIRQEGRSQQCAKQCEIHGDEGSGCGSVFDGFDLPVWHGLCRKKGPLDVRGALYYIQYIYIGAGFDLEGG